MSYYGDQCRGKFSEDQKDIMRTAMQTSSYTFLFNAPTECLIPLGYVRQICSYAVDATHLNRPVKQDLINISNNCTIPTGSSGEYNSLSCSFTGVQRIIVPDKNYGIPLDGVSTADLVRISRHILDIEPFESPFQFIAADANNSGSVTGIDIIAIKRVIQGILDYFPAGNMRYISEAWVNDQAFMLQFDDANPFDAAIPDPFNGFIRTYLPTTNPISYNSSWMDYMNLSVNDPYGLSDPFWAFDAIKVGDVNCDNTIGAFTNTGEEYTFGVANGSNIILSPGQTKRYEVIAQVSEPVAAWQFGVKYPGDLLNITHVYAGDPTLDFDPDNFYATEAVTGETNLGTLRALWFSPTGSTATINNKALFEIEVNAETAIDHLENILKIDPHTLGLAFYDADLNEISGVSLLLKEKQNLIDGEDRNDGDTPSKMKVWPTIFKNNLFFTITVPVDQPSEARLFDMLGKEITRISQNLTAGENELILPDLNRLAPGIYHYFVKTGSSTFTGKVVKQ